MSRCITKRIYAGIMMILLLMMLLVNTDITNAKGKPGLSQSSVSLQIKSSQTIKIKNVKKKNLKKLTVRAKNKRLVKIKTTTSGKKPAIRLTGKKAGNTIVYVKIKLKKSKKVYRIDLPANVTDPINSGLKPIKEDRKGFSIWTISDGLFYRMKAGNTYKNNCIVPRSDLRYIQALHKDKEGKVHQGEMVVHKLIADDVLDILEKLYDANYPIERMVLPDNYMADDETMMRDNNSSSFNFRFISHTTTISKHGLGMAVDINTMYNPYHKIVKNDDGTEKEVIEPLTGKPYLDRSKDFDYKINKGDLCYRLFIEKGFEWGGNWTDRKDYQHFELPTDITDKYSKKYQIK